MPDLDPKTLEELRESIRDNGVVVPVVVDEFGNVLDGHHRKAIAGELGIDYPEITVKVSR